MNFVIVDFNFSEYHTQVIRNQICFNDCWNLHDIDDDLDDNLHGCWGDKLQEDKMRQTHHVHW